jgi:predicted nucleotidyltransferase
MCEQTHTQFGLDEKTINKITQVFTRHVEVTGAVLYGSRAKGNYKLGSDIDITLKGEDLTLTILNRIEQEIDELNLPYSMDLSIFHQIDNQDLIDHIIRMGKVILPINDRSGI